MGEPPLSKRGGMGRGGESGSTPTAASAADLLGGQQFQPFLQPDFDAGEFASQALADAHITAQAQTDQLQVHGLALIGQRLQSMCMSCAMQFFDQIRHFCGIMLESGGEIAAQGRCRMRLLEWSRQHSNAIVLSPYQTSSPILSGLLQLFGLHPSFAALTGLQSVKVLACRAPRRSARY